MNNRKQNDQKRQNTLKSYDVSKPDTATFYMPVHEQIEFVEKCISLAQRQIGDPAAGQHNGILIIKNKGTKTEWYIKQADHSLRYLSKSQEEIAARLAQRSYTILFLRKAEAMLKELKNMKSLAAQKSASYMFHALSEPYEKLSEARKKLIRPYVLPDDELIRTWEKAEYLRKEFEAGVPVIISEKGERVRSKSEKILADKLYLMKIPYRYEFPLHLKNVGTLNPDFTLLDIYERKTVIYEHFGMMDDPVYCKNTLRKIEQYEKAGYYLGRQLLCTFESNQHVLDMKHFELMIKERFQLKN